MRLPVSILSGVTIALLVGTLLLSATTERRIPEFLAVPLSQFDSHVGDWTASADQRLTDGVLRQLKPTEYLSRTYRKNNVNADLFIAYYAQQRAGESMHSPKHCLPGAGWEIWQHGSAKVPVNGKDVEVNRYSIHNNGTRMLMFYWYQSRTRIFSNEYMGKLLLARDTFLTGRTGGSIVRIILPDTPTAYAEGVALAAEVIPRMQRAFGSTEAVSSR
jgi:EpsI family protein